MRGVRYACQLAKDVGAEVIIFNVVLLDETNVVNKQEVERRKQLEEFIAEKIAGSGADLTIRKSSRCRATLMAPLSIAQKRRASI